MKPFFSTNSFVKLIPLRPRVVFQFCNIKVSSGYSRSLDFVKVLVPGSLRDRNQVGCLRSFYVIIHRFFWTYVSFGFISQMSDN